MENRFYIRDKDYDIYIERKKAEFENQIIRNQADEVEDTLETTSSLDLIIKEIAGINSYRSFSDEKLCSNNIYLSRVFKYVLEFPFNEENSSY